MPSTRSERIKLRIDSIASAGVVANGSDIVEIIASVEDERGYVKQLANEQIEFSIIGEGTSYWRNGNWCKSGTGNQRNSATAPAHNNPCWKNHGNCTHLFRWC